MRFFGRPASESKVQTQLVVANSIFQLADGAVIVADEFFHDFGDRATPFDLELVIETPDGASISTTATISQPFIHARPPRAAGFFCTFHDLSKSDIPVGSRLMLPIVPLD